MASRRRGVPIREISASSGSGSGPGNLPDADESDEEEGSGQSLLATNHGRMGPIADCRAKSSSAWLHFPHVELVFLFFAFEGAMASQASAIKHAECVTTFYLGLLALVSNKCVPTISKNTARSRAELPASPSKTAQTDDTGSCCTVDLVIMLLNTQYGCIDQ